MWEWMAELGYRIMSFLFGDWKKQSPMAWKEKASYAIGVDLARSIKRAGMELKAEELVKGVRDELSGARLLMAERDLRATISAFQAEMKGKRLCNGTKPAEKYMKEGWFSPDRRGGKVEIMTMPSGLQFKIYREDDAGNPVRRNYAREAPSSA